MHIFVKAKSRHEQTACVSALACDQVVCCRLVAKVVYLMEGRKVFCRPIQGAFACSLHFRIQLGMVSCEYPGKVWVGGLRKYAKAARLGV